VSRELLTFSLDKWTAIAALLPFIVTSRHPVAFSLISDNLSFDQAREVRRTSFNLRQSDGKDPHRTQSARAKTGIL
jgi:hypothetical protein